jgi:hypothetical protein
MGYADGAAIVEELPKAQVCGSSSGWVVLRKQDGHREIEAPIGDGRQGDEGFDRVVCADRSDHLNGLSRGFAAHGDERCIPEEPAAVPGWVEVDGGRCDLGAPVRERQGDVRWLAVQDVEVGLGLPHHPVSATGDRGR